MPTTVPSPRSKGQTARAAGTNRESFQPALTNLPPRLVLWLGRLVGCGRSHLHAPCVTPHGLHWPARRSLHPGPRLIPAPAPVPAGSPSRVHTASKRLASRVRRKQSNGFRKSSLFSTRRPQRSHPAAPPAVSRRARTPSCPIGGCPGKVVTRWRLSVLTD